MRCCRWRRALHHRRLRAGNPAPYGDDLHARARQLLAQAVHDHLHRVGARIAVQVEDLVEQMHLADRLAGLVQQCGQRSVLTRRERQRLARQQECLASGVELQGPATQTRKRPAAAAADERHQPRFQLGQRERLGEEIVRAGIEPAHAFIQCALRGEDQYRRAIVARAHVGQHGKAILARQAQVQHHCVKFSGAQEGFGDDAISGALDHEAALRQRARQPCGQFFLILHQQNPHRVSLNIVLATFS